MVKQINLDTGTDRKRVKNGLKQEKQGEREREVEMYEKGDRGKPRYIYRERMWERDRDRQIDRQRERERERLYNLNEI